MTINRTRHSELLYWSVVDDTYNKNYTANRIKNFSYKSLLEIELWKNQEFANASIPFYCFIDELKKIISDNNISIVDSNDPLAKRKILFVLRVSTLFFAASNIMSPIFQLIKDKDSNDFNHIFSIITISKNIIERIQRELFYNDPNFFIQDIFGGIRLAQSSSVLFKIKEDFNQIQKFLDDIDQSNILESFFDFSTELHSHFSPHVPASEDDREIALFADGPAWVLNSLENNMYSIVFGSKLPKDKSSVLLFVEHMRLYYMQADASIKKNRSFFMAQIAKNFISQKVASSDYFMLSAGVLGNLKPEDIENFLSRSYNANVVTMSSEKIKNIVIHELQTHLSNINILDKDSSTKIFKLVFSNIITKVSSAFSLNNPEAFLVLHQNNHSKEEFTMMLGKTIRDAYLSFIQGKHQ